MDLFEEACMYAINAHRGQKRKDGTMYILHPFEVATIATTMTNDVEVLASCILHDVPEDCNIPISQITNLFGERVGKLVGLETESKFSNVTKEESWKLRKQEAINRLITSDDIGFKIIYLSDKLANIRSLIRDFKSNGINAFNKFNMKDMNEHAWYYYSVLDNISELEQFDAYKEYEEKINYIFKDYKEEILNGKNNHNL